MRGEVSSRLLFKREVGGMRGPVGERQDELATGSSPPVNTKVHVVQTQL